MGLLVVGVLQAVFETAQKAIGGDELFHTVGRQQAALGEQGERVERWTDLQRAVAATADELKDLRDEFDFADAARAELDVIGLVLARYFAANLRVQVAHGVDRAEVEVLAINERADDFTQRLDPMILPVLARIHASRLDPGITLPFAALRDQIVFQRDERTDQRSGITVRAQAHVDAENPAVAGDVVERSDQAFAETDEKIINLDPAAARPPGLAIAVRRAGRFTVLGIDEDVVNVGGDVEFAPAEFAHADHHQALRTALPVERLAENVG